MTPLSDLTDLAHLSPLAYGRSMRVKGFRGHPDVHLWRWPLRWLPVAICRRCAALVVDPLRHASWHARNQPDARN